MIKIENYIGDIVISPDFIARLAGKAASECFGVVGMANSTPTQGLRSILSRKESPDKGIKVRSIGGKLYIDMHIVVTYGVNISAIVKSIVNKVRYTVEETTGLDVVKVNVFVDGMLSA